MRLCPLCGIGTETAEGMCAHHSYMSGNDWATHNRMMCDFIHRRIVPAVAPLGAEEEIVEWAA